MTTPAAEPRTTPEGSTSPNQPAPDPTQQRAAKVTAPRLGVRPSTPSPSTENRPTGAPDSANAGAQLPPDPLAENGNTPSASELSDPGDRPLSIKKKPLAEVLRGLVLGASLIVHQSLARTELEQQHGVWAMQSEDEAASIADPLANIAQRRAGGQLVNPDLGDLIAAGVAAASYVLRNATKAFQIRRAEREMRRAGVNPTGDQPREDTQQ